jgi:hypothetical protein
MRLLISPVRINPQNQQTMTFAMKIAKVDVQEVLNRGSKKAFDVGRKKLRKITNSLHEGL